VRVGNGIDERLKDGFFIVSDNEDFFDLGDLRDSTEAMLDDRVAGNREERLRRC
jgi:hypothetical protein